MSVRFATSEEISRWNAFILSNPDGGNVFSSYEYAKQKETGGYTHRFLFIDNLAVTVLEKNTPPLGKLWYLPKGPNVTSPKTLFDTLKLMTPFAKKRGVFVIRIETELPRTQQPTLSRHGLKKAAPIIPNPSTITLDLHPNLKAILMGLPQKGRHAIRRAERDGVTVELVEATDKNCKKMYQLLSETAEGQFGIRSYDYYKTFWQRFAAAGYGQLFFASFKDKVVAGAYAMTYGTKSTYKDGASIRKRTAYGASHLLQWRVIEWAKSRGALIHDFCGSPPSDELDNRDHPHYGIGQFKTAFNKTVTDYIGCYDFVINPIRYKAWTKLGERVYRHFYYKRTKDYYY
ncbi:MAG: peptidoglycan bridge formation glycyltransferase FemA/FemB family protein [Candidatus Microsaccharimonas sossegonensis]|uniref:Peptidoglycan bridge formation glycyltransferase FemA/FemB family protein n=1 Tax=Candidatus Microsaccharimonas sossegonensis TaxID=2506948 RepID=A0A4Q0AH36_9BACT|nr:MAG: peptidoglycan bridge formation glycyltransferase FemA/FemB family protein [Candidatus Microsaccharimonas sossegonensis]